MQQYFDHTDFYLISFIIFLSHLSDFFIGYFLLATFFFISRSKKINIYFRFLYFHPISFIIFFYHLSIEIEKYTTNFPSIQLPFDRFSALHQYTEGLLSNSQHFSTYSVYLKHVLNTTFTCSTQGKHHFHFQYSKHTLANRNTLPLHKRPKERRSVACCIPPAFYLSSTDFPSLIQRRPNPNTPHFSRTLIFQRFFYNNDCF